MASLSAQGVFWKAYWGIYSQLCGIRSYQNSIKRAITLLEVSKNSVALDMGCGIGSTAGALQEQCGKVVGMDNSESGLEIAKQSFPGPEYIFGDINKKLPLENEVFNAVLAHNVMYLAASPVQTLLEVYRILKPGGIFVMSSPKNGGKPMEILKEHLQLFREELLGTQESKLVVSLKTSVEAVRSFLLFLEFLPFQIALEMKFGGASNFWSQERWETVIQEAGAQGALFNILSVEPIYGGQNNMFALQKPR
ncbi:MAG: ubiquinone/menaquinone biosynthesis methyltransferase [Candidatus Saganbacteria bacterium]|uniref:Ubiquinone/menaquinone biosynthesis methyltransferase n=1 Tax=Candidatus Saganbacteria bacterium TaxID=2575572 RepID=A0A833L1M5_UNCSA|nr:MAG: ubiquinone/menaquinone biosynthesis methyltransferase [Candidatus Saganbacteria bacterium]